jgi:hypothetical protein
MLLSRFMSLEPQIHSVKSTIDYAKKHSNPIPEILDMLTNETKVLWCVSFMLFFMMNLTRIIESLSPGV